MKRWVCIFCIGLCSFAVAFAVLPKIGLVPSSAQTAPPPETRETRDICLNCHGPYEKLAGQAPGYAAASGEKINPHTYVPHTSKEAKAVPECANCHEPHPVPPKASDIAGLPKPDVQWCYTTCHHQNSFEPCKDCHKQ